MVERTPKSVAKVPAPSGFIDTLNANVVRMIERGFSGDDVAVVAAVASFFSGVFSAVYDRNGVCLWLSPGFSSVIGVEESGLIGRSIFENFPEPWCRERLALIGRSLEDHRPFSTVEIFRGRRLEGTVLPVFLPSGAAFAAYVGRCGLAVSPFPAIENANDSDRLLELVQLVEADWGPLAGLTRRELEVLRLIAKGLENATIAKAIHRTKRAVEWHIGHLYEALRCTQRTELFRIGLVAGLPDIDEPHWMAMIRNVHDGRDQEGAMRSRKRTNSGTS